MQETPQILNTIANTTLQGMSNAILECGLSPIQRSYVGFGPTPSEDCCPDLVVWVSNLRLYDQAPPDTLQENRVLNHYGLAFEINIRLGLPYWEMTDEGHLRPIADVQADASALNEYGRVTYLASIQTVTGAAEIQTHDGVVSVTPNPTFEFQEGGCAGFQWSIALGLL